jgi:hypothetical protein
MNDVQKILLAVYIPLTVLVIIFENFCFETDIINYLKYTIIITLFLAVISVKKKFPEQRIMARSFYYVVMADFFFVLYGTFHLKLDLSFIGGLGFFLAYLVLIKAYGKNFRINKISVPVAIPIAVIYAFILAAIYPYVNIFIFFGVLVFGIVIGLMTLRAICTIFMKYYNPKIAIIIAISAILMFICDAGEIVATFNPAYAPTAAPWLQNIIWASYIPGWALLAVVINEKKLLLQHEASHDS